MNLILEARAAYDVQFNAEFVPSRAQIEKALQPVVAKLLSMPHEEAREAMKGAQPGRAEALVIYLYKQQRGT
jgi:hypothetical protein